MPLKDSPLMREWEKRKQKENQMSERQSLNMIRISIGLGKAPNTGTFELSYSDEEGANPLIMAKKRETAINEAQKLHSEALLVFAPETAQTHAVPVPSAPQAQAPAPKAPQATGSSTPPCKHGTRVFKNGTSKKTGKPWKGWMCPIENRDEQCEPIFFN